MAEGEAGSTDFTVFPDVDLTRVYDQHNDSKVSKMEKQVNDGTLGGTTGAPQTRVSRENVSILY